MSKKLPRCRFCAEPFHPDRRNASRQGFCKRIECVTERKRIRQRRWYKRRRREDTEFRESENARCAEANRRRRSTHKEPDPAADVPDTVFLSHVVTGLLSQVIDSTDPEHLHSSMHRYADRGRRVASSKTAETYPP